jgi:hypothetical protein
MPDPVETLIVLVEAAVAIAGFSGVVIVFGRRATGEWSRIERARLLNLLLMSFSVLFLSLLTLVLLHAGTAPATTWRIGSGTWSVIAIQRIAVTIRNYARIPQEDPERPGIMVPTSLLGVSAIVVLLSLGNVIALKEFWPFLAALVWLFGLACYSFAQLLFSSVRGGVPGSRAPGR